MEQELKCPICDRFLENPVVLPCFHSACLGCVERTAVENVPQRPGLPTRTKSEAVDTALLKCRPFPSSASATVLSEFDRGEAMKRRQSACADFNRGLRDWNRGVVGFDMEPASWTAAPRGSCASSDESTSVLIQHGGVGVGGMDFSTDVCSLDKMSIVSETDSGVVICDSHSRPISCFSNNQITNQESLGSLNLFCPACNQYVCLNDLGVAGLTKNRPLEVLVEKYSNRLKPPAECQLCEGEQRALAVVTCRQCQVSYCQACLETCHPLRGPLAKHTLLEVTEAERRAKLRSEQLKCAEHLDEDLSMFCATCQLPVCCLCICSGRHVNHSVQDAGIALKTHKVELTKVLHKLSERARFASDILQKLKCAKGSVKENSLDFEAIMVAKFDQLIQAINTRKQQLLERIEHERQHKEEMFDNQIAEGTSTLRKMTGLLQINIELLKEADAIPFLQISNGLITRVAHAEQSFLKDFSVEPRVLATFDMHLDIEPMLKAVQSLNLYHLKAPSCPSIFLEECSVDRNTVTVSWQLSESSVAVDGFVLELADASSSEFREVFRGTETLCLVEGLHFNTKYLARVRAYNHAGSSEFSEPISLQTAKVARFIFDPTSGHPDIRLANGNTTISCSSTDSCVVLGSVGFSRGMHYWEFTVDQFENNSDPAFGVARFDVEKDTMLGKTDRGWSMYVDSNRSWFMHSNDHHTRLDGGIRAGSTVGVLLDLDIHTLSFYVNKKPRGSSAAFLNLRGTFFPSVSINRNVKLTLNSGIAPPLNYYSD